MKTSHDNLKRQAYGFCKDFAENRIKRINKSIKAVGSSLASETKSSAGDKHETGRAMLQLEREKLGRQLFEAEKMLGQLQRIKTGKDSAVVILGSLVTTNEANYYIAISAGRFEWENEAVYCISANTPIGKILMGKTKGSGFHFNGTEQRIEKVN